MSAHLAEAGRSALLLVDTQTRLLAVIPDADRDRLMLNTSRLLRAATLLEVPQLVTEQYPQGLGPTEPTLAALLAPSPQRFEKTSFSCCGAPGFDGRLQDTGRHQVVVMGIEAHVCVLQTCFDLLARGHQVFLVEDAIAARDPRNTANAVARMRHAGIVVTNTESVLFEWLRDAQHEAFRTVMGWLKETTAQDAGGR
jgi:nicotinamidase-related amidase